jgi:hypothetical protein
LNNENRIISVNAEQNEQQPDLPDLTRLFKNRARDESVIQKCKHLLIAGMPPGKVALLLRLPLEKVLGLYENSYNPRCRRFAKTNAYQNARLALQSFQEGESLADISAALGMPIYTLVQSLLKNGVAESAINERFPPTGDPLMVEYLRVCERKARSKFTPVKMYSNRKLHPSTAAAVTQRPALH